MMQRRTRQRLAAFFFGILIAGCTGIAPAVYYKAPPSYYDNHPFHRPIKREDGSAYKSYKNPVPNDDKVIVDELNDISREVEDLHRKMEP